MRKNLNKGNIFHASLNRHKITTIFQENTGGRMFSDLTHGYWSAASHLHKLAEQDASENEGGFSQHTPSCVSLYCIAADALLNSILGRLHIFSARPELIESAYKVACMSLSEDKLKKFAYILDMSGKFESGFTKEFKILENLRGEVIHFVPVPSRRGEWRGRVLEATRRAGIPKNEMIGIDWCAALCKIQIARWSRKTVMGLSERIESNFNWGPQLYPTNMKDKIGQLMLNP